MESPHRFLGTTVELHQGRFQDADVADESLDWIITDPPYAHGTSRVEPFGELLREMPKHKGGRPSENMRESSACFSPKLADLNLDRKTASN